MISRVGLGAAAVLLALGGVAVVRSSQDYSLDIVMPAATNLVAGSSVQVNGAPAGKVSDLEVRDGKAVVTVTLSDDYAPLPDGTTARVSYKALLGERILELVSGEQSNPDLKSGALIEGTVDRVELDQLLGVLDAPTRVKLQGALDGLSSTLDGSEDDLRSTLQTLGPAVRTLGEVLQALGSDGPAIRSLVTRLADVTRTLQVRSTELSGTVNDLTTATGAVSSRRQQLGAALDALPETLNTTQATFAKVPGTVDAATPLLQALRPGVELLPSVSRQLRPVLADLRPTIADLRPTLSSLSSLLDQTPALLDTGSALLPQVDTTLEGLGPAVSYLRPYTPELIGWLSNWGSAAANYDSNGHYLRTFITQGTPGLTVSPDVLPPGVTRQLKRYPGESEGQPWTDANGGEMQ